jgi:hypothetical protein
MSSVDTALQPAVARDQARALFGQTMGLVAVTAGLFALGAYLGRDLSHGWGFVAFIASFGLLIGLYVAASRSEQLAIGLLFPRRPQRLPALTVSLQSRLGVHTVETAAQLVVSAGSTPSDRAEPTA